MYLGINLIKEVNNLYNENIKSFKKSNKAVEFPYSYTGKINIMKK